MIPHSVTVLILLISVIYCQTPSWSQLHADKFQSNNIQFSKPHAEWKAGFIVNDFEESSNVAFNVNRGKMIAYSGYDKTLSFVQVDLLNGAQQVLKYPINRDLINPHASNLVIDGNSNAYLSIVDDNGIKIMAKVDLTNTSSILYTNIDNDDNDQFIITDDGNFLISTHSENITIYQTSTLKQVQSRNFGNSVASITTLAVGNDLYINSADQLYKLNLKTGSLIGMTIPHVITSMSYSGIPGWIVLGMTHVEHRWHHSAMLGIVNVDLNMFTMNILLSDSTMTRDPPGTSNVVSNFKIVNSTSSSTTFQINSILQAYTGGKGGYFGVTSTFKIGKDMSDVSNLEIKKSWTGNYNGYTVASAQSDRKSVVLMNGNNNYVVVSNDENVKIIKTITTEPSSNYERKVVTGQNNMIYSLSFYENGIVVDAINMK